MVGIDSTSRRAHQHAAGARKARPRVPKKGRRPGTTAPTRASDGPGAVRPPRSTSPGKAAAAPWLYRSLQGSKVTPHRRSRPWTESGFPADWADGPGPGPTMPAAKGLQLPPKPPLPAKTPHQAHDPQAEGPTGQPTAQRQRGRQTRPLRPRALPAPQQGRTDHQPTQELPSGRHPLRQEAYAFHGTVTTATVRLWLPPMIRRTPLAV